MGNLEIIEEKYVLSLKRINTELSEYFLEYGGLVNVFDYYGLSDEKGKDILVMNSILYLNPESK